MKKVVLLTVIVVLAAGGWYLYATYRGAAEKDNPTEPQTVQVTRGPLRIVVEATGRVIPNLEVEIKSKASGEVVKLPFDVSDPVKKGVLLVQLDPVDEERSVRKQEVALAVSEAKLAQARLGYQVDEQALKTDTRQARAQLASAEAALKEVQAKLTRATQLFERKMTSQEGYDAAESTAAKSAADVEVVRATIEALATQEIALKSRQHDILIAEQQIELDKIALDESRQRLNETKVVAPIDGVVSERDIQIGQIIASGTNNVGGGTTLMKLADLSRIFVLASVDESDIGKIAPGQNVTLTADAYPTLQFTGRVVRVATKGVNTSDVVTFEVKIEVEGENRRLLKPEMTANIEVLVYEKVDALLVPVEAVSRRRGTPVVRVPGASDTAEQRAVTIGMTNGEHVEILSGLNEGDAIELRENATQSRWQGDNRQGGPPRPPIMRARP